jgi:phosphoketolase
MEVPSASGRWDPDRRYPWLIHRLTYRRTNHHNIHVRRYKEEGTTTPFEIWSCATISTASISAAT